MRFFPRAVRVKRSQSPELLFVFCKQAYDRRIDLLRELLMIWTILCVLFYVPGIPIAFVGYLFLDPWHWYRAFVWPVALEDGLSCCFPGLN